MKSFIYKTGGPFLLSSGAFGRTDFNRAFRSQASDAVRPAIDSLTLTEPQVGSACRAEIARISACRLAHCGHAHVAKVVSTAALHSCRSRSFPKLLGVHWYRPTRFVLLLSVRNSGASLGPRSPLANVQTSWGVQLGSGRPHSFGCPEPAHRPQARTTPIT